MGDLGQQLEDSDVKLIQSLIETIPVLDSPRGFYKIHGVYQSFVPMFYDGKAPKINPDTPEDLVNLLKEFADETRLSRVNEGDEVPINAPGPLDCTRAILFETFDKMKPKFDTILENLKDLVPVPLEGVMYDRDCLFFPIMTMRDGQRCVTLAPLIVAGDVRDGAEEDVDAGLLDRTYMMNKLLREYSDVLKGKSSAGTGATQEELERLGNQLKDSEDALKDLKDTVANLKSSESDAISERDDLKNQVTALEKQLNDALSASSGSKATPSVTVTPANKEKLRKEAKGSQDQINKKIERIVQNYGKLYEAMRKIVSQYRDLRKTTLEASEKLHDTVGTFADESTFTVEAIGKNSKRMDADEYYKAINEDISNAGLKSLKLPKWDEDTGDELEETEDGDKEEYENDDREEPAEEEGDNETEGLGAYLYEKGIRLGKPKVGASANKLLTASSIALKRLCPDIAANAVPASPSEDVDASVFVPDKALASDGKTPISFSEAHKDEYSTSYTLLNARFEDKSRDLTDFQKLVNKIPDNEAINANVIDKLEGYFSDLQDESRKAFNIASKDSGFTDILNKANLDIMFDQCHRHVNEVFYALATAKFGVRFLDMEGPLKASRHTKLKNLGEIITSIKQSIAAFAKGGNFAANPKAAHAWFMLSFGMTIEKKRNPQALKYENGTPLNFQPSMAPLPLAEMLHSGFWLCFFWFDLVIPKSGGDKAKAMAINNIFAKNSRLVDGTPPQSLGPSDDMDTSGPAVYDDDGNLNEFGLGRFKNIEDDLFDYNLKRSPKGGEELRVKMSEHEAEFFLGDNKILRITSTHAKDIHKLVHEGMNVAEIFISDNGVVLTDAAGKMHVFDIEV